MRSFTVSFIVVVLLVIGFIVGALNTQTGLMVAGFCLTPLVLIVLGWTARGAFGGRRVALVEVERRSVSPGQQQRRRGNNTTAPVEGHTI